VNRIATTPRLASKARTLPPVHGRATARGALPPLRNGATGLAGDGRRRKAPAPGGGSSVPDPFLQLLNQNSSATADTDEVGGRGAKHNGGVGDDGFLELLDDAFGKEAEVEARCPRSQLQPVSEQVQRVKILLRPTIQRRLLPLPPRLLSSSGSAAPSATASEEEDSSPDSGA